MGLLAAIFGEGKDLSSLQMGMRAAAVFFASLFAGWISGRRSFGQRSSSCHGVAVLLGATLSRVIVGASPSIPSVIASLVIVSLHRALVWACVHLRRLEPLVVGVAREVFRDGQFNACQLSAALITRADVLETVRKELGTQSLEKVSIAIPKRNGELSLIRKEMDPAVPTSWP
jgi:uncharacterized membrane protein YcaP (DUF421 family)